MGGWSRETLFGLNLYEAKSGVIIFPGGRGGGGGGGGVYKVEAYICLSKQKY